MNRYFYTLFFLIVIARFSFSQNRPTDINGLQLWLRADSNVVLNGSTVSVWKDCSGNGNDVAQNIGSNQPTLVNDVLNGNPVLHFNGSTTYLDGGTSMCQVGATGMTFFIIEKSNSATGALVVKSFAGNNATRWGIFYEGSTIISGYNSAFGNKIVRTPGKYEMLSVLWNRGLLTNKLFINTELKGSWTLSSTSPNNAFNFLIGAYNSTQGTLPPYPGYNLNGDIAEILIYNKPLTNSERNIIERYLLYKYAKTISLGNDLVVKSNLCDTIIHAGSGFATYKWSTGETTESIKAGKGRYSITVTDNNGFASSDTIAVIYPNSTELAPHKSAVCEKGSIILKTTSQTQKYTYHWNTGYTGNTLTVTNTGKYFATVSDGGSCNQITDTAAIEVDYFASTVSLGNDTALCKGNSISLATKNIPKGTSYLWNTSETNDTIKVNSSGVYSITATDANGCSGIDSVNVTVSGQAPNTDFKIVPNKQNIRCTNTSVPSGSEWKWYFGDGSQSTEENPNHTYLIGGFYNIQFQATDNGCSNTTTKQLYVSPFDKTGLMQWLRADSNISATQNGGIISWGDCSGQGNTVGQSEVSLQPVLKQSVFNGFPAILFNGTTSYLNGGNICNITNMGITVFIVGKSNNQTGTYVAKSFFGGVPKRYAFMYESDNIEYLYDDDGKSPELISKLNNNHQIDLVTAITDKANVKNSLYHHGSLAGTYPIKYGFSMESDYPFLIGAYNNSTGGIPPVSGYYLNGFIAEIIIFDRPLPDYDRQQVESYLRYKYGKPPVELGSDITVKNKMCDTLIHAGKGYMNYAWNTGDTTEWIKVNKSGYYEVGVTDSLGYASTDIIKITYNVEPKLIPDTTICPGATLNWDTKLNTSDFTFKWNTGETSSAIDIKNAGNYILTVSDKFGCSFVSDTVHISTDDFDKSIDIGNDTVLCNYNEIMLRKGGDRAISYLWNDGTTGKAVTIQNAGKYYLTATDTYSCKAVDSISIKVAGVAPDTKFTITGHCQNDSILFADNSVSRDASVIDSWMWIVEQDTLKGKQSGYRFAKTGNNYVTLKVSTNGMCDGEKTLPIFIDPKPVVAFIPQTFCQYAPVEFVNKSTISSGKTAHLSWLVNDSIINDMDTVKIIFTSQGQKSTTLKVTSDKQCSDSLVQITEVRSSPKAIISASATCNMGDYYIFDKSEVPSTNGILERRWTINSFPAGNGSEYFVRTPDTTESADVVKLFVRSVNGCFDTTSQTIPYSFLPEAKMEIQSACVGDTAYFIDKSTVKNGSIVKWKWNIGDDYESFVQNPKIVLQQSKTYDVSLKIQTNSGCEDTVTSVVKTMIKPRAAFNFGPKIVGAPVDITFTNNSDSATSYIWDFGDGTVSSEKSPVHEYADSGNYFIKLNVFNDLMCADSLTKQFHLSRSNYNLVMPGIFTTDKKGYISISAVFLNAGLNPLNTIDFILTKDDGTWVKETWKGELTTGAVDTFTFASNFKELDGMLPRYICVDAHVLNKLDSIVSDTSVCITNIDELTGFNVYPIPANDKLTVTFAVPEAGGVTLELIDNVGKTVVVHNSDVNAGFNSITISTIQLSQGFYYWKLTSGSATKAGTLLINRYIGK